MAVSPLTFPNFIDTTADEQRWQIYNAITLSGGGGGGGGNVTIVNPVDGSGNVQVDLITSLPTGTNSIGNVNPDTSGNGSVTASTPLAITTVNNSTLGFSANGGATGTVTIEGTVDGTNWLATSYVALASGGVSSSFNAATQTIGQINTSGLLAVRFRSNTIVGTVPIYYITSRNVSNVMLDNPLPAGANVIGATYSTPNVAAGTLLNQGSTGFATTGGTLAAATRKYLLIQNTGTTNPLYVTTDGTTPSATNGFTLATNGGGIVFDGSFVPNGAIVLASTATNFSILWA
jgi:hypothetical protein